MMTKKEFFAKAYFELCELHGFYIQNNYCCCGNSSIEEIPAPVKDDEYSYEWERFKSHEYDIREQIAKARKDQLE
jgi:hypothetical protein